MLYSQLSLFGFFSMDELKNFRQWGSTTPGHPELNIQKGIENTSGPLGQGHSYAVGAAIAEQFLTTRFGKWMSHKTYAYISDGGVQEGISQCVGRIAGNLGLHNLIMFYDSNDVQLSTYVNEVSCEDTAKKYEAWGWNVITINGNEKSEIRQALQQANEEKEKPFLIIGRTMMGKGAKKENGDSYEGQVSTHGQPLSKAGASFQKSIISLGGDPENAFLIFPDVAEYYKKIAEIKTQAATEKKTIQKQWEKENPLLATKLKIFYSGETPDIDYNAIVQKANSPTRNASAVVLEYFAKNIENMIVGSADLANSDKTDGFLKHTKSLQKGDFSGKFLQAGVSELGLSAILNGIVLHGGVFAAGGTFFSFSDYMKPSVRMAALMELPIKLIWTHDSFRVGEDGPTHQPVEQEAQIRLLEKLRNHHGDRSILVLRPADTLETSVAWKMAMENTKTPTALILSRQSIKDLPAKPGSTRYQDALESVKGAYIVKDCDGKPDVVLVGNGSEVRTLLDGAELLIQKKSLNIRVVSVISEGLFREQSKTYQKQIIPDNIPVYGLTAGLPVTLEGLVGTKGKVWGLESFGYSAPFEVLDEKFGFTADNVYKQVEDLLAVN
jgi:transketolase